jgi:hypothetical protein
MIDKLKTFFRIVAHTLLSFAAAMASGLALSSSLRPALGKVRYSEFAHTPTMIVLLLTGVAIVGGLIYRRWADWTALFAWLLPVLWVCHLMLSRGAAEMEGQWSDPLFLLEGGAAYSAGAFIAAMVAKKMSHKLPARLP